MDTFIIKQESFNSFFAEVSTSMEQSNGIQSRGNGFSGIEIRLPNSIYVRKDKTVAGDVYQFSFDDRAAGSGDSLTIVKTYQVLAFDDHSNVLSLSSKTISEYVATH